MLNGVKISDEVTMRIMVLGLVCIFFLSCGKGSGSGGGGGGSNSAPTPAPNSSNNSNAQGPPPVAEPCVDSGASASFLCYSIVESWNGQTCATGARVFHDYESYCNALIDEEFNNGCGQLERNKLYDQQCARHW